MDIFRDKINWKVSVLEGQLADMINSMLEKKLRIICKEILRIIPKVVSIYLTDSFSCGEGSIFVDDDKIKFMSDIDLLVISRAPQFVLEIKSNLLRKYLNNEIQRYANKNRQIVDLNIINEKKIEKFSTLSLSKIKNAKCIYGYDVLKRELVKIYCVNINTNLASWEEILNTFFDRIIDLLASFSFSLAHSKCKSEEKRRLMFATAKLVSISRDIFLILNEIYFSTKEERQRYLRQHWASSKFCQLAKELPFFLQLSENCHRYMLRPTAGAEEEALTMALGAIQVCSKILTFPIFIEKLHLIISKRRTWIWKNSILQALFFILLSLKNGKINENLLVKAEKVLKIYNYSENYQRTIEERWEIAKNVLCKRYNSPPFLIRFLKFISKIF
ncbi:MAG: hypothetical protein LM601_08610 [Candidatus Verstraetearchaeota archaeon]|nr:hypothetical protein [Candidatus Verstraetearchaeota archaeon]